MTQEDKQLLLRDLSARLPYGVKCYPVITNGEPNTIGGYCEILEDFYIREVGGWFNISMIKPYLRPMSSMTWEEKKEFSIFGFEVIDHINANREGCPKYQVIEVSNFSGITEITDWLNAHHFDYNGLIEKGLALEAPEGMYI